MASTIKVDNVQNQPGTNIINKCSVTTTIGAGAGETVAVCAATVNLGRSGGTVNLTSGATQSGFGRTGTVDWQTGSIKTSVFTAANGEGYFCNTSGGAFVVNLPAGVAGNIVSLVDYTNTFQTYSLTVTPNGSEKLGGIAASAVLNTQGQSVTFVYVDGTEGWKNIQDSTSDVTGNPFMVASVSGACNTLATAPCCANTKIATFKGPGTFCVSQVHPCAANNLVSYMVLAGGGGANNNIGGGAGAGGFREYKSPVTPYTSSPLDGNPGGTSVTVTASPYTIVVGGGGVAQTPAPVTRTAGGVSTFSTICSAGGAVPAGQDGNPTPSDADGGSGGGNGHRGVGGGVGNTPPVSPAQGTPGGGGPGSQNYSGGGGGGATGAGTAAPNSGAPSTGGPGGTGATTSISATPTVYAGGGGGGVYGPGGGGTGGPGGGGPGSACSVAGNDGTINTGGGGGGGGEGSPTGGAGGSGVVVIRYKFQ